MKLRIAWIQAKPGKDKSAAVQSLTAEYVKRISRYTPVETHELASEAALLKLLDKSVRTPPVLVLLDSGGKQLSSEEIAGFISRHGDRGIPQMLFAVGGADGFSEEARRQAHLVLSLGKITIAHELARVVLLEQLYRAFTIIKGHPYHCGH
jgi:23S rRNA (pseudouridine1915-N3)-methyltransferase